MQPERDLSIASMYIQCNQRESINRRHVYPKQTVSIYTYKYSHDEVVHAALLNHSPTVQRPSVAYSATAVT